jgi:3-keto-L-gulonate-6-phosphate decarboxylase
MAEEAGEREAMEQRRRTPDRAKVGVAGGITRDAIAAIVEIAPTARIAAANGSIETAGDIDAIADADGAVVVQPSEEEAPRAALPR